MKPLLLAPLAINHPPIAHAIKAAHLLDRGEIDSKSMDVSFWDSASFFKALQDRNYRKRECQKYAPLTLTYIDGSARWHTDPGFGLVACWLVYSENYPGFDAQLITTRKPLDLRENDLCIFDSDQGHAWISNGVCVMVMATVAPIKKKRARV